jgi:hypothetical protein
MFEYDLFSLKISDFIKIKYLDENRLNFQYKKRELVVFGKNLKVINLLDKSLEIKGIIEKIEIKYLGEIYD